MPERFKHDSPASAAFPPRELWLYNPIKEGRLEVLYDPHGFNIVDMDASLDLLLSTVETKQSGYQFASTYADLHHGEHDERDYPYEPDAAVNPREFRGLASNKRIYPRVTHAWWHRVFEKPKLATTEGMRLAIAAEKPIASFVGSVAYANQLSLDRRRRFNHREFHHQIQMRMGFYAGLLDTLRDDIPPEFQIIAAESLESVEAESVDDIIRVARMLRKYARPRAPLPIVIEEARANSIPRSIAA